MAIGGGKESDEIIYFAYGSNMLKSRMIDRTPSALVLGIGKLENMKVAYNKESVDGSGKANLIDSPGDVVYGVLYKLKLSERGALDIAEGGYERQDVEVALNDKKVNAFVYISSILTNEPTAYDWYRDIILEGAAEHGLPDDYIEHLSKLPYKPS